MRVLRDSHHRAVSPPGELRGGGPHRDVSGRRFRAPGGGHHRGAVGSKVSPATISELNKKAYVHIEDWRNRPLQGGKYPYVYVGIYLKRNWGGEYENVAVLVAIAVNEDGFREVLGAAEGMKEDKASGSVSSSGCADAAWTA